MSTTPHVAAPSALVDPSGACGEAEACRVLTSLLDVLGDVATASGREEASKEELDAALLLCHASCEKD